MRGMIRCASLLTLAGLTACTPTENNTTPPPPATPPSLIGLTPNNGLTAGGDTVTLSGSNLDDITAVAFGTAIATIGSKGASELTVTTPANARGPVTVKVTSPDGTADLANAFTYQEGVAISTVSPASVPANRATSITIDGTGFQLDGQNPVVKLNTTAVTITSASATSVTVDVPALTVGSYDVTVTNADGRSDTKAGGLTVIEPVVVAGVTPNWGFAAQTTQVTISGSGFTGTTAVVFGAQNATTFNVSSSTSLTATAPTTATAGPVDVIVRRGIGDEGTLVGGFTYYSTSDTTLRVLGVSPAIGRGAGGTQVDVWGTGLDNTTTFRFGGIEAAVLQTYDATHVKVTTPAHSLSGTLVSEPVDVVATKNGTNATLAGGFTFYRMPQIFSLTPTTLATAGGDTVTIQGEGFTTGSTQVFFGASAATNVVVTDQANLTCTSPAHAEAANVPVKVQSQFETSAEWSGVTFMEMTRIQSITPDTVSKAGRSFLTLKGTGLADVVSLNVTVTNGTATNPVDDLTRVDQTTLTFRLRGPMVAGVWSVKLRNTANGQEDTKTITASDLTDKDRVHSGGALAHNLNLTVLRDDTNARVQGAIAFVGDTGAVTEGSYNKGLTDADGLLVLSGDKTATGPVTLTVGLNGFETITLIGLNATNVVVLLSPKAPVGTAIDYGVISGAITGWNNTGYPSGANPTNRYYRVAQVFVSDEDPMRSNIATGLRAWAVETRNDQSFPCRLYDFNYSVPLTLYDNSFAVNSLPGTRALLGLVWYWDSVNGVCGDQPVWGSTECQQANYQNCEAWAYATATDILMGTTGGISTGIAVEGGGGNNAGNNISLNVPLVNYSLNINGNPSVFGASYTAYAADSFLDLGNSGSFTFMGALKTTGTNISLGQVPMLQSSWTYSVRGIVSAPYMDGTDIVGMQAPYAYSWVRALQNMSPQTLSTWVYFPNEMGYTKPANSEGRFSYTRSGGVTPDFTYVSAYDDAGNDNISPLWSVLAKGDPRTITLPDLGGEARIDGIASGNHFFRLWQIKVDNFDFDNHMAKERTQLGWRAGTATEEVVFNRP